MLWKILRMCLSRHHPGASQLLLLCQLSRCLKTYSTLLLRINYYFKFSPFTFKKKKKFPMFSNLNLVKNYACFLNKEPNKTKEKNDCEYTKLQSFLALKKDPALILFVMRLSYYSIIVRANKSQNIQYIIDC